MSEMIPPVKNGQEIIIPVEFEGNKGDAVAKIDKFVIIVKKAQIGKTYRVRVNEVHKTYAFARILEEYKED